jgi:DNA mismatch repair ATPase MutS
MNKPDWLKLKALYPGKTLLAKEGQEWKAYGADALKVARDTGLAVKGGAFCAIPCNQAEKYFGKLLAAGHKIVTLDTATGELEEILKQESFAEIPAAAIGAGQVDWETKQRKPGPQGELFG